MDDMMKQKIQLMSKSLDNLSQEEKAAVEGFVAGLEMGQQILARKDQEGGAA